MISPDDDEGDEADGDDEVAADGGDETGTAAFVDLGPWWSAPPGVDMGLREIGRAHV